MFSSRQLSTCIYIHLSVTLSCGSHVIRSFLFLLSTVSLPPSFSLCMCLFQPLCVRAHCCVCATITIKYTGGEAKGMRLMLTSYMNVKREPFASPRSRGSCIYTYAASCRHNTMTAVYDQLCPLLLLVCVCCLQPGGQGSAPGLPPCSLYPPRLPGGAVSCCFIGFPWLRRLARLTRLAICNFMVKCQVCRTAGSKPNERFALAGYEVVRVVGSTLVFLGCAVF